MTTHGTWLNKTRSTEWMLALCLLLWGVEIMQPNETFATPIYVFMRDLMRETAWGACAVTIAALRVGGLGINGFWRRSPILRLAGSLASGLFWLAICLLMHMGHSKVGGYMPPGARAFYPVFFVFEGWCVAAAGYDLQKNRSLSYRAA